MENILNSEVPDIGVEVLRPSQYESQSKKVVETKMASWYDWLVGHVPKTIRRRTSVAYRFMRQKVMSLFRYEFEVVPRRRLLSGVVTHYHIKSKDVTSPLDFKWGLSDS